MALDRDARRLRRGHGVLARGSAGVARRRLARRVEAGAGLDGLAGAARGGIADTAAYFAGRAFGRRKLAPTISPGKTWEGVYGALLATAVYTLVLLLLAPEAIHAGPLSPPALFGWVGLVLSLTGLSVVGDLFKSLLKRQRGVKDSGRILPGHGGVIDRIDALLAVMPPAALLAQYALH